MFKVRNKKTQKSYKLVSKFEIKREYNNKFSEEYQSYCLTKVIVFTANS